MPNSEHIPDPAPQASSSDFHRIFDQQIDGLYLLSSRLTGDARRQSFVPGLQDSAQGNPVFKQWARRWTGMFLSSGRGNLTDSVVLARAVGRLHRGR
jgi:hypothetical protein